MSDSQNVYRECSDCGRIAFEPKHCESCVTAYPHSGAQMEYCADCRTECVSCHEFLCEEHMSGRECKACAGPTDRELERMNNADNAPSESSYRAQMADAGRSHLL